MNTIDATMKRVPNKIEQLPLQSISEAPDELICPRRIISRKGPYEKCHRLPTDENVNTLFLSALLKTQYADFYHRFENILRDHGISCFLLDHTREIWCRDYMPVALGNGRFVQFVYNPAYLRYKKYIGTKTNCAEAFPPAYRQPDKSMIILEGGNVVSCGNSVIISDSVFRNNSKTNPGAVLKELENIFGLPVIIIPRIPGDFTGHADGMLRFYSKDAVLVNDSSQLTSYEARRKAAQLLSVLKDSGLDIINVPYYPNDNRNYSSAFGCYINYLRINKTVFLPVFGNKDHDKIALRCFRDLFSDVVPVPSHEIAAEGGVLNCISWTVKK